MARLARPLRLMLVEDDPDFQAALRVVLRRVSASGDVETVFESRVEDALAHVGKEPLDAIISDFGLPDGDGVDVLEEARRTTPGTHRVVLTGSPDAVRARNGYASCVERLWDKRQEARELESRFHLLISELSQTRLAG